jgi:hypothetical protein
MKGDTVFERTKNSLAAGVGGNNMALLKTEGKFSQLLARLIIKPHAYMSIGVGYTIPFQMFAAEWIDADKLASSMNALSIPGVGIVEQTATVVRVKQPAFVDTQAAQRKRYSAESML